jgi:hypothetical protein
MLNVLEQKIKDRISSLKSANKVLEVTTDEVMNDNLVDLVQGQMLDGENGDGQQIGTYASSTIMARNRKGLQTNYIDLFFTGEFFEGMDVIDSGDSYSVFSSVSYATDLDIRYPMIFGVQDENKKLLKDSIIFNTVKKLKNG